MDIRTLIFSHEATDLDVMLKTVGMAPGVEVVAAVQTPINLVTGVRAAQPEVLVMHLDGYSPTWVELISELRGLEILRGIVISADITDNSHIIALLKAGINALIPRTSSPEILGTAIREAANEGLYIPPRR